MATKKKAKRSAKKKTSKRATKSRASAKKKPARRAAKPAARKSAVKKRSSAKKPARKAAKAPARKAAKRSTPKKAAPRKAAPKSIVAKKPTPRSSGVLGEGDWKSDERYSENLQKWGASHDAEALARNAEADLPEDLRTSADEDVAGAASRGVEKKEEPDEEW